MAWLSSGRIVNPILDQVLLDTGALTPAPRNFQVMIASTVNAAIELQWRDAANTATLKSQFITVPAFGFVQTEPFLRDIEMLLNERIRILIAAAVTGSVSVSLDIPL
jgi:hypothetical protein